MSTTPTKITTPINKLCAQLGIGWKPELIPVKQRPDSGFRDCFEDVTRQVSEHGGELVTGWIIWEWKSILVEAEFHAVWRNPNGKLVDMSVKPDGEPLVMFVVDKTRKYAGRRVDNVRIPIGKDVAVREFIKKKSEFFAAFEEKYPGAIGEVQLTEELTELQHEINIRAAQLQITHGGG